MSLQENPADGIELGKVYNAFVERFPDIELLAAKIGWPAERILTFSNYNGLSCKYHMSTLEQTIRLFCRDPGGFGLHHIYTPSYELGGSCPTIALRRL
jgi:hypothetical protein